MNHILRYLAQRVQRPGEKVNHALVLGGAQGIGKDTLLEPLKYAVGPWNFVEVSPLHLTGNFNGFVKSVVLRVSEARDLGDGKQTAFYEHTKVYTAAPPDVLRVNEKHLREYDVPNVCGVIITTNHKTDGMFLPADDRRHYVAWSDRTREEFPKGYWDRLHGWYAAGGLRHVAAFLAAYDLAGAAYGLPGFDPKAPPPQTAAFWDVVNANRPQEDAELADLLEALGKPAAVTLACLYRFARTDLKWAEVVVWLADRGNRRVLPKRLEAAGYALAPNNDARDRLWRGKVSGRRQAIYARTDLDGRERHRAARELAETV
jgi:hypothetical protein